MSDQSSTSRRTFLKAATGMTVGASLAGVVTLPKTVHAGVDEKLRIGLVGCGNRGTAAALDALSASPDNVLVAVGDVFDDMAHSCVSKLRRAGHTKDQVRVDDDHVFVGFDAYQHVVDNVDVVLLATPPFFRPQQLAYAVQAGKHCFVEKPVAVDPPGVRSVMASCQAAEEKGLSIVSGLCWRYDPSVQETVRRVVEDKAIGDIVSIQSTYNGGQLWHRGDKPEWNRMAYEIRNWLYFTWLSGDHICEQAVHSLDKCAWLLGDTTPSQVFALGGRQQRTGSEYGNVYDHFTAFYEFPTGVRVFFTCRQQNGCAGLVDELVLGTKGQAWILKNRIEGEHPWHYHGRPANKYRLEHEALFHAIRSGKPINNGTYMAQSTMIAIMGRMAAYTGGSLTWDECLNSPYRLGPEQCTWTDDVPKLDVAIPGVTKLPLASTQASVR